MAMPPLPELNTDPLGDLTGYEALYGTVAAGDQDKVTQAIADASAFMRMAMDVTISQVTDEDVVMDGRGSYTLMLPEWPVTDVTDVVVDGDAWEADWYEWSEYLGIVYARNGRIFPRRPQIVSLTYTHGWDPVPPPIVEAVYKRARRGLNSDGRDVRTEQLGAYSVTYASLAAGVSAGLTTDEERVIRRYKIR